MVALADCNSFFASVERALHPGLKHRPVCVLSSNDGNIVALTPEAKALGIRRGDPLFKVRNVIDKNNVAIFSGNLMLYAAMSKRVQSIMRQCVSRTEPYSIDEQFLYLDGYEAHHDLVKMMREMVEKIRLWTDIPVSVGIARTKTLAKVASKFAKKYPGYRSVCIIDDDEKRRKALSMSELADIWGIGRRTLEKLISFGVATPLAFADKPGEWVLRHFHKPGYQTWRELNGYPCIDTSEIQDRQTITTSRSFGSMITSLDDLKASVASFTASCAATLRSQNSSAGEVTVFIMSNRFREDLPQYMNCDSERLELPSSDTLELTQAALKIVERIYRPGIHYKKSGVILSRIADGLSQPVLFDHVPNRKERIDLSQCIDNMNLKFGLKTVRLGVEGEEDSSWKVKSDFRTPNYLTDIDELLTINV